uniref:S1 motif domain-containing protein n=1 Tax=Ditylenchus dipsaci TaxID=166011 RepID=A0A915DY86_9BILA
MEQKTNKKMKPSAVTTIQDEKEYLKEVLPGRLNAEVEKKSKSRRTKRRTNVIDPDPQSIPVDITGRRMATDMEGSVLEVDHHVKRDTKPKGKPQQLDVSQLKLDGFRQKVEGLIHISQLKNERVNAVADVVNRGQSVKVKVTKIDGTKLSLSMKEKALMNQRLLLLPPLLPNAQDSTLYTGKMELKQMQGGGALSQMDMPDFDEQ